MEINMCIHQILLIINRFIQQYLLDVLNMFHGYNLTDLYLKKKASLINTKLYITDFIDSLNMMQWNFSIIFLTYPLPFQMYLDPPRLL